MLSSSGFHFTQALHDWLRQPNSSRTSPPAIRICGWQVSSLSWGAIFDQITATLARGGRVQMHGFGTFTVKRRNARIGRQSAHRRGGARAPEDGAVLQSRQGTARAAQSRWEETEPRCHD
jgi:hypothetical protein